MSVPVKRWQLLIAEIIFEYNEYLKRKEGWNTSYCSLDDYDNFVNGMPEEFDAGEFGVFKIIQEIDDSYAENSHKRKMIFSWNGKFYEFLYDIFSYEGAVFDNYDDPLSEVEPVTETVRRYVYT